MLDTQTAILQALISGPSYGLEVIERVGTASGGRIKLLQGRVYPVLRRLESEGLLRSWNGESVAETGGRPRRYYELTAEGMRAARADAKAINGVFGLGEVSHARR
jgi:PadR family transcriptional regulator PadR